jgi:SAM-dependent methyltransferase
MSDPLQDFLNTKISSETETYKDIFENSVALKQIKTETSSIGIDWTYTMMHLMAQKVLVSLLKDTDENLLLDVGSQFSFITFAATFYQVICIEPRFEDGSIGVPGVCKITSINAEAQNLPIKDNMLDVITSLHAIEHFGLGRYGDTLDYYGDQKGIKEFYRTLKLGGHLLIGVPAASESRIDFNSQRVYNPYDFDARVEDAGFVKKMGNISYAPGSSMTAVSGIESLDTYPKDYTPPVYIALYQKQEKDEW